MAYNNVNAGLDRTIDWSGKHHIHGHPEALWTKIKNLKALFSHDKELYASKKGHIKCSYITRKSCRPEIQKPQKIRR